MRRLWIQMSLTVLADPALAADTWRMQIEPDGSTRMQPRYSTDLNQTYRGEVDRWGDVRLRNYQGDTLRGNVDTDGYGRLRDQSGNTWRVRPW